MFISDCCSDNSFAYNFDLADLHGAASNGTITYHGDAPGYTSLGGSTVSADGTYHLIVTDNGCADTTAVTTQETGDPDASWSGGSGVCSGNSADLTATITGGSGDYTVHYTDGTNPLSATLTASGETISLGAGTYTLDSVVDNNGCSDLNIDDTEVITTQAAIADKSKK